MPESDADTPVAQLAFEREKWQAETGFKERELALREREQRNREAETELKRAEQERSRWTNPLTVAIAAAALAGLGNAAATWWNGKLQRLLEQHKANQQLHLEENKSESERILEVIKTGGHL